MTVSNTENSITVQGNDLTTVFSYDFPMGGSSAYAVLVYTDADGLSTTIPSSDFTVADVDSEDGGTFTYPLVGSAIATGTSLTLSRELPLVQSAAIGNQGNFYPSVVERALDYQMMALQQISGSGGSSATINAQSLFGNPDSTDAAGSSIGIGAGLSFSGATLVVSGISGSGSVTEVNTGSGLSGGPITGVGTVSMSAIANGAVLGNFSGAALAPQAVTLSAGSGITLSKTTTSVTIASNGYALISSGVAAASQTAITFSSITSTYRDLIIVLTARSAQAATTASTLLMTFNGDGGSNYNSQRNNASAADGDNAAESLGATQFTIGGMVPGAAATANYYGQVEITIASYTSAFNKTYFANAGRSALDTSGNTIVGSSFGMWKSTASITTVTIAMTSAPAFENGSIYAMYGRG